MSKPLEELEQEEYICPGAEEFSSEEGFLSPNKGLKMSYRKCMEFPDCGCSRFYKQGDLIDEALKEEKLEHV